MSQTLFIQGRRWQPEQIGQIRCWLQENPWWSRYRLSRELCHRWQWARPNGQLADMAARSFLLKLHERELIVLPPKQCASPNRMKHRRLECVPLDRSPVAATLQVLGPLELHEVGADPRRRAVFETLLAQEHYLGYRSPVGQNLKYLLCTSTDRPLAAWLFGAAAWRCQVRDQWIGWTDAQRAQGLGQLTNNTRFLVPPWVRVSGLASWGWGRVRRRLMEDWQAKYGQDLELVETFVDGSRFQGRCYAASHWLELGMTQGRSRADRHRLLQVPPKRVYVYPLKAGVQQRLCR